MLKNAGPAGVGMKRSDMPHLGHKLFAPCDPAIDMSLLIGIITALLVAAYTRWSVWGGFAGGTMMAAVLCALGYTLRQTKR
jgi:hypothetical protein